MKNFVYTLLLIFCLGGVICSAVVAGGSIEPAPHDVSTIVKVHTTRTPYELAMLSLPAEPE